MRYWFDTEFIERGPEHPIRLLSIGIVAEDGRELYCEIQDARFVREDFKRYGDPWLTDNVLPHIVTSGIPRSEIARTAAEIATSFLNEAEMGHRGYVGDHFIRTVQFNERWIETQRASLATIDAPAGEKREHWLIYANGIARPLRHVVRDAEGVPARVQARLG